ncbi:hypothetical protein [Lentilactobacillus parakefiri]|uniref:Uncharacterized protein n=1 Tax=Lentilactobacillus parakefiri TaxID=152332 RepID=A0A269YKG9_9LACO|nr:hypothetical protein [Lentilactobacillus parakefiri]KRL72969.1 hypothetical protein FD08_GL003249 [Lentilactobacillus parakefiri DSM 10551]PAK86057.1 hypothetical protein B8W98_03515 [Lentilactobacillus parakefiri]PAL01199.1 hypothetical protein B8W96_02835 [Lentilactobacillus parakefiri]TDG92307.1 hypothetical protein C5L28_002038 [Lentilactobacillus parakefiri]GAW71471.1 hypothetical protein LPKJCM_00552 [Lentilactobacillus parakefiri]
MNLKTILYATGAAMGIFATSATAGTTANAAVSPTPQSQQANKTNTGNQTANSSKNQQTSQSKSNTDKAAKDSAAAKGADQSKAATTTPAKTQTTAGNKATTPAKTTTNNNQQSNNSTPSKAADKAATTSTTFDRRAPRLTGSAYKSENAGYKPTVQNTHASKNVTVKYSINTYESDGSASSKPFQIKIYKDGSLYKTINASSGTATGSFSAPKGTFTLRVYTSQSTHYTGGLSVE